MKIWLDDIRPMPPTYDHHSYSVDDAKMTIMECERNHIAIECIDCDHDMGEYFTHGGDGINLIDWLVERETFYPIKLHTANPVGRANMERTINRYWS